VLVTSSWLGEGLGEGEAVGVPENMASVDFLRVLLFLPWLKNDATAAFLERSAGRLMLRACRCPE